MVIAVFLKVKPTMYNIFSYILFNVIDLRNKTYAIKHNVEKKFKTCFIFFTTVIYYFAVVSILAYNNPNKKKIHLLIVKHT